MNALFTYLVESAASLTVLYIIYWFFLRRDTFFGLNRVYLVSMLLFSVVVPLLPIHWQQSSQTGSLVVMLEPVIITSSKVKTVFGEHLQWIEVAAVVYLTGVVIFLVRFLLQLVQIFMITRRFGAIRRDGSRVIHVDRGYAPFSFFNMVFINKATVPANSLETILNHERVHMRQFHSIDLVLLELVGILQWFNPVVWLTGRELKSIHEFLADEGVLQNGLSPLLYQQMILDEAMGVRVNMLTNNFNVSLIKKRIAMMTKSKSNIWAKGKLLIALPACILLFFLMTATSFSNTELLTAPGSPVITATQPVAAPVPVIQDKPKQEKQEKQVKYVSPVDGKEVFTVVEKPPTFEGGQAGYSKFLVENIKYPEEALKKGVTGTVYISFIIEKDGTLTSAKVMRGIGSGCDEEALRVVKMMPKWNPGEQKGKPVAVQFNLPIKFKLDSNKDGKPK